MQLQRKVRLQRFFGGVNRQIGEKEYEELLKRDLHGYADEFDTTSESLMLLGTCGRSSRCVRPQCRCLRRACR